MKGIIVLCLKDMVEKYLSTQAWNEISQEIIPDTQVITSTSNIEDSKVLDIIKEMCSRMNITAQQAADAFGDYWVNVYSQKMYAGMYKMHKDAKTFLTSLDKIHAICTNNIADAHPPQFICKESDNNSMFMTYISERGLVDIFIGLVRGVGKYYKEKIDISKEGPDKIKITFKGKI
ncbi:MAG: heme NO-binding domain-containing protein [Oligoflexia bacterium]|nr:heme NO-binding domain-containing protein [Oligoflexia bacterium]